MLHCSIVRSKVLLTDSCRIKERNMSTSTKSTKEETNELTYGVAACATLLNKGLERVAEVSKSSLDMAVAQNTEFLTSCKKAISVPLPGAFLFDVAGSAFEGYVALQKSLLGLAVEQSTAVLEATQECSLDSDKANALIQQSLDRSVAAQSSVLDYAAKQTKAAGESVKQQPGVTGSPVETVTDSVQKGVDTVVAAQKEILNLATKTVKSSTVKA
jgi:hypothetical protein